MKKNFLKVAALLIAAMLLVVSCSQEVAPKTEDNGLVEARLNVAFGRDLTVNGDTNVEEFDVKYSMSFLWTDQASGKIDAVTGAVDDKPLHASGKLGWVTPGYWKITVKAYEKNTQNVVFEGDASVYFTHNSNTATIYLEPAKGEKNSIVFGFYMQDLGETYATDYVVKYTITKNGLSLGKDYTNIAFTEEQAKKVYKTENGTTLEQPTSNPVYDNQRCYTKTISNLDSGYYTVTVSVYVKGKNGLELKGGVSKGMLLVDGDTANVTGHIEPSDYVATQVKSYFVDVDTELTLVGDEGFTLSEDKKSATVKVSFTDKTKVKQFDSNLDVADFSRNYYWLVDGSETPISVQSVNAYEIDKAKEETFTVTNPGVKNISCRTIYSYKVSDDKIYYWAETKTVSVKVTGIEY